MDFNALEKAAIGAIDNGRFADAIRIYLFMSDGDSSLDGGYLGERLGYCYEALGDIAAARFWYSRAIEENPEARQDSVAALLRLGRDTYEELLRLGS